MFVVFLFMSSLHQILMGTHLWVLLLWEAWMGCIYPYLEQRFAGEIKARQRRGKRAECYMETREHWNRKRSRGQGGLRSWEKGERSNKWRSKISWKMDFNSQYSLKDAVRQWQLIWLSEVERREKLSVWMWEEGKENGQVERFYLLEGENIQSWLSKVMEQGTGTWKGWGTGKHLAGEKEQGCSSGGAAQQKWQTWKNHGTEKSTIQTSETSSVRDIRGKNRTGWQGSHRYVFN